MPTPRSQVFSMLLAPPSFLTRVLTGFGDASLLITPLGEPSVVSTGADGETVIIMTGEAGATMALTMKQSSPSNQILSNAFNLFRASGLGRGPFTWSDPNSADKFAAPDAWVTNMPAVGRGKGEVMHIWPLQTAFYTMNLGGSAQPVA